MFQYIELVAALVGDAMEFRSGESWHASGSGFRSLGPLGFELKHVGVVHFAQVCVCSGSKLHHFNAATSKLTLSTAREQQFPVEARATATAPDVWVAQ